MPPKKQKVKVRKTSKRGDKGVNIKIVIDQSKKTKGIAPKPPAPPTQRRNLPAFSAMPQGPSYMGANYPTRQDAPVPPPLDLNVMSDRIYNNLLEESNRRERSARGFGGFQTAGQQLNQIFDGQYRAGRNNYPIISNPNESSTTREIDFAVFDDPTTNNQILGNKLNNRGSMLPETGENSIVQLDADERRDNNLDNLVLHEKKSKMEATVNDALDEELLEENLENEDFVLQEIPTSGGQAQQAKELSLQAEEQKYVGRVATPKIRDALSEYYNLPPYPPAKKASIKELKDYINAMNREIGTDYETDFKGRKAVDDLRRVIRIGLLKAYDDL
jgi:hypothetical protein